jgi:hypothetical protein
MQDWAKIRRRVLVEGVSKRLVCREQGLHWDTLQKILTYPEPPGYRRSQPPGSKLDDYRETIAQILAESKERRKASHNSAIRRRCTQINAAMADFISLGAKCE